MCLVYIISTNIWATISVGNLKYSLGSYQTHRGIFFSKQKELNTQILLTIGIVSKLKLAQKLCFLTVSNAGLFCSVPVSASTNQYIQ